MSVPLPSQIKPAVQPRPSKSSSTEKVTDESNSSPKRMAYGKRPAHLTDRPLRDNEGLKALRDSLSESPKGRVSPKKRAPRRAQRP